MQSLYYNAKEAGSYGGISRLSRYSRESIPTVKSFLRTQDAYTLHKPVRHKFARRKTYAKGPYDLIQIDLADMQSLAKYNEGHRFILCCIDVFTRKAFARGLKDKRGTTVAEALASILDETPLPVNFVQSDRGVEFLCHNVQTLFKDRNIHHYSSYNDSIKCALVERFNRSLKDRMYRYFTKNNTYKWIDVLQDLVDSYNKSYHRSIKMAPVEVNEENANLVRETLYPIKPTPVWKYNVGDKVRISKNVTFSIKVIYLDGQMNCAQSCVVCRPIP